jgi:hypothetical protein
LKIQVIRFGTNEDQIRHTFRHTDQLGLNRDDIAEAIRADLTRRQSVLPGTYITGKVGIDGAVLEYRAYGLADGTVNVGRITGV